MGAETTAARYPHAQKGQQATLEKPLSGDSLLPSSTHNLTTVKYTNSQPPTPWHPALEHPFGTTPDTHE
jgi:hypothetical protein